MPQSLGKILLHLVFSTKNRARLLPDEPFVPLHKYAFGIFEEQKCHLIEMNTTVDGRFKMNSANCCNGTRLIMTNGTSGTSRSRRTPSGCNLISR